MTKVPISRAMMIVLVMLGLALFTATSSSAANGAAITQAPTLTATLPSTQTATQAATQAATTQSETPFYAGIPQTTSSTGAPVLGSPKAPLILAYFADFSCPHCLEYAPVMRQIIDKYVRTGQARLLYEPETFVGGTYSEVATEAALCAGKQGYFWEMHDALFDLAQNEGAQAFTQPRILGAASMMHLDGDKIDGDKMAACMNSHETQSVYVTARAFGESLGVTGVPSVLYSTDGKTYHWFTGANGQVISNGGPTLNTLVEGIKKYAVGVPIASTSAASGKATALPTWTPAPSSTPDTSAFDMSSATTFTSPDTVLTVKIPHAWQTQATSQPGSYAFSYTSGESSTDKSSLTIIVGESAVIYGSLGLSVDKIDGPEAALKSISATPLTGGKFGAVAPATIGTLKGWGLPITIKAETGTGSDQFEIRMADLPDGKIVVTIVQSPDTVQEAKPALDKMVDSIVVHAEKIPTPTAIPPIQLSLTAVQKQIDALTPTPSPTFRPATATLRPSATSNKPVDPYNVAAGKVFQTSDKVLSLRLPRGWESNGQPGQFSYPSYNFAYKSGTDTVASIQIGVGSPEVIYPSFFAITTPVANPQEALKALISTVGPSVGIKFGDIHPVKISRLSGFGVSASIAAQGTNPATEIEVSLAALPDGRVMYITIQADSKVAEKALPALHQIAASVMINPARIPTVVPSATPHPLMLTQAALQGQVTQTAP